MGNSLPLPPCVRHLDAEEGTAGAKKMRRKQKSPPACRGRNVRAARHVVPVADTLPEDGGEVLKEAWRPGCRVEAAGGGGGEDGGGVRRVKIVMRRKDIAELVARLEQRDAAEIRNAAVMEAAAAELISTAGLGGGGDSDVDVGGRGGGVTMMSPCRDTWKPRLSIIPENY
ncbi:unnamed protein product [Urochloa humidicola]